MELEQVLSIIQNHRDKLKIFGVTKIGVFGSTARHESLPGSDLDLLVEFEESSRTFKNYMRLYDFLEEIIPVKIDLSTPGGISAYIKPYVEKEIVYEEL